MSGEPQAAERSGQIRFSTVDPRSDDAVGSMSAYFDELARRFPEGFDPGDTLVSDAATFDEPHGVFVVARSEDGGAAIACGGVHLLDGSCGEIKRMWVHPDWRGMGIGRSLLSTLESHGARLGYDMIRLDTHSALTDAISMYQSSGYRSIERYNDNPFAKHWFEKALEAETP